MLELAKWSMFNGQYFIFLVRKKKEHVLRGHKSGGVRVGEFLTVVTVTVSFLRYILYKKEAAYPKEKWEKQPQTFNIKSDKCIMKVPDPFGHAGPSQVPHGFWVHSI